MKYRPIIALILLLAFGAARMPFEHQLTAEHRAAFFHTADININLRKEIGPFGILAALSGFRAIVADVLWIQAFTAWTHTQWGRMVLLFNSVVELQPREVMFWDMASWHMAWNASVAAMDDPNQPNGVLRVRTAHQYYKLGEDYLLRGIQNNPDRYELYDRLAMLYKEKFKDSCKAADMYQKASVFKDAPVYEIRFYGYELSRCPGQEQKAYELLRKLYLQGQNEWLPTLLERLAYLQDKLNVPAAERVYNPSKPSPAPSPTHP